MSTATTNIGTDQPGSDIATFIEAVCGREIKIEIHGTRGGNAGPWRLPFEPGKFTEAATKALALSADSLRVDLMMEGAPAGSHLASSSSYGVRPRRRVFLVKVEPVLAAEHAMAGDVNPSKTEQEAAKRLAQQVVESLIELGFPLPIVIDGRLDFTLIFGVDMPDDDATEARFLAAREGLSERFHSPGARIRIEDPHGFRLAPMPNTWCRTANPRPDRQDGIVQLYGKSSRCGDKLGIIDAGMLARLAADGKPDEPPPSPHQVATIPAPVSTSRAEGQVEQRGESSAGADPELNPTHTAILSRDIAALNRTATDPKPQVEKIGSAADAPAENDAGGYAQHTSIKDELSLPDSFPPRPAVATKSSTLKRNAERADATPFGDIDAYRTIMSRIAACQVLTPSEVTRMPLDWHDLYTLMVGAVEPEKALVSWLGSVAARDQAKGTSLATAYWEATEEGRRGQTDSSVRETVAGAVEVHNRTELGNARRIIDLYGIDFRFCGKWGKWLFYNGKRWVEDDSGEIDRRAKKTIASIYREAADCEDQDERGRLVSWATKSESHKVIVAMIALARTEPTVPIQPDELNTDKLLLACDNGTLDLRTGEMRPHRREDYITKCSPVTYDADAKCPKWLQFLDDIMRGNKAVIDYLQRALGYSLSGSVDEQCMFLLHGNGKNGKSVFLQVVQEILGGHAITLRSQVLMTVGAKDHPTELCDLDGARFVATSEIEGGQKLAEALVKLITGKDRIKSRRCHKDPYEFPPTAKIWMAANHKPVINGTDEGIWRRMRLIPFKVIISLKKRNTKLPEQLIAEEGPGILAWMVRGFTEWSRIGLQDPEEVVEAVKQYREESDVVGDFIRDRCAVNESIRFAVNPLYAGYREWAQKLGHTVMSSRAFGSTMNDKGFAVADSNGTRYRLGIGLRAETDDSRGYGSD